MNDLTNLGETLQSIRVKRIWGTEIWLCNTDQYCAKFLDIYSDMMPIHLHPKKDETMINLSKYPVYVWLEANVEDAKPVPKLIKLNPQDSVFIENNTWHTIVTDAESNFVWLADRQRWNPLLHLNQSSCSLSSTAAKRQSINKNIQFPPVRILEVSTTHSDEDVVFR